MNEKIKKISVLEWGIAIVIVAIIIAIIHQNLTARMNTSFNLIFPLLMLPILIGTLIFFLEALHYFILQKTLKEQHPFGHVQQVLPYLPVLAKTKLQYMPMKIYGTLIVITATLISLALYSTYVKQFIKNLNPLGTFMLFFAGVTTSIFLIFSNFYFAKPVKETWKAVLLAGIIAGASSFVLSYGLWKFVGPYLA